MWSCKGVKGLLNRPEDTRGTVIVTRSSNELVKYSLHLFWPLPWFIYCLTFFINFLDPDKRDFVPLYLLYYRPKSRDLPTKPRLFHSRLKNCFKGHDLCNFITTTKSHSYHPPTPVKEVRLGPPSHLTLPEIFTGSGRIRNLFDSLLCKTIPPKRKDGRRSETRHFLPLPVAQPPIRLSESSLLFFLL